MRMNASGKVLIIFLIITIILLVSLTALTIFFFQKEIDRRKLAEVTLEQSKASILKLEAELQDAIKQGFLLQEKNKEADEQINSLLDDLELEKGLREEAKLENLSLKEQLEKAIKAKEEIQKELEGIRSASGEKITELETKLNAELNIKTDLEQKLKAIEQRNQELEGQLQSFAPGTPQPVTDLNATAPSEEKSHSDEEVELEKIVVAPPRMLNGRILTVDTETDFVIVDLGEKDGILVDKILSVYRNDNYLGDIKVTRVQPEMSAADFIPPFSSQMVSKDDQVVVER